MYFSDEVPQASRPREPPARRAGTSNTARYCVSPQKGHFAVRACSGFRQCQQKLG